MLINCPILIHISLSQSFYQVTTLFQAFNENTDKKSSVWTILFQIYQFSVGKVLHVLFNSNIDIGKIATAVGGRFFWQFFVFTCRGLFPWIWIIINNRDIWTQISVFVYFSKSLQTFNGNMKKTIAVKFWRYKFLVGTILFVSFKSKLCLKRF